MQRGVFPLRAKCLQQAPVERLHEVVPALVQAVDRAFHRRNYRIGSAGIARLVLFMPQIEVGAVLSKHQSIKRIARRLVRGRGLVPASCGLLLQIDDVPGV